MKKMMNLKYDRVTRFLANYHVQRLSFGHFGGTTPQLLHLFVIMQLIGA